MISTKPTAVPEGDKHMNENSQTGTAEGDTHMASSVNYQRKESSVDSTRRTAVVAGLFFLLTEVTAVAGLLLYNTVLHNANYIVAGPGGDSRVLLGAFSEAMLAIANIGTAVTLFPIVKRQNEGIALGYVCGRLLESVVIVVGAISLLSIVTLRQTFAGDAGAHAAALGVVGRALVAIHDWTFLLGPDLALGVNTSLLAYLMYRSGLVPRLIATLGLIGGPVIFASAVAVMFGLYAQLSTLGALAGLPVLAWEVSLGVWLIVKGFKPSPITSDNTRPVTAGGRSPAPAAAAG